MSHFKLYRITYLISSKLEEEKASQVSKELTSFIKEKKGKIESEKELTKRNLAYPINKDRLAYLGDVVFRLDLQDLPAFRKFISSQKNIERFLLVKTELPQEKPSSAKSFKTEKAVKPAEESVDQKLNKILED